MKVDIIDLHFTFHPTVESFELTDAIEVSHTGVYLVEVSFVLFFVSLNKQPSLFTNDWW